MLKIGLTGGIGSGKSSVAGIFEVLGVPVYYADTEAKRLMSEDAEVKAAIQHSFGERAYIDGLPDRKYLSAAVFNNSEKLALLNSIVHPATLHDVGRWISEQTAAYIIKEAALIFESGSEKSLDYVIGVSAPESLRIARVMKRDNLSEEEVISRLRNLFVFLRVFVSSWQILTPAYTTSLLKPSLILLNPSSIFSMLLAKDSRMQLGSPKAFPVTEETCASFRRYMQRSSASAITCSPFFLPKYLSTRGNT